MQTLLLDVDTWDLTVDTAGNISVASDPYSMAQDAASSIRVFEGEVYFDKTLGIPYYQQILGYSPPLSLLKAYFVAAALLVPGVTKARCFFTSWENRVLKGQVQIEDSTGTTSVAGF